MNMPPPDPPEQHRQQPVPVMQPLSYSGRRPRPWWVNVALLGLPNRASAFVMMWISLLIAAAGPALSVWITGAWLLAFFVFAAVWYWAAITWVDRSDQWD